MSVDAQPSDITILSPAVDRFDGQCRISVWSDSSNAVVTVNGINTTRRRLCQICVALDTKTNTLEAMLLTARQVHDRLSQSGLHRPDQH